MTETAVSTTLYRVGSMLDRMTIVQTTVVPGGVRDDETRVTWETEDHETWVMVKALTGEREEALQDCDPWKYVTAHVQAHAYWVQFNQEGNGWHQGERSQVALPERLEGSDTAIQVHVDHYRVVLWANGSSSAPSYASDWRKVPMVDDLDTEAGTALTEALFAE
jgi:hypothetical protein